LQLTESLCLNRTKYKEKSGSPRYKRKNLNLS
jgi:hypothetical protein